MKTDNRIETFIFKPNTFKAEFLKAFANCDLYSLVILRISPRPISIGQLRTLLHFHLRPINLVVFQGSYLLRVGDLILGSVSRLDAFSVYLIRTSLPCYAVGTTTGAQ